MIGNWQPGKELWFQRLTGVALWFVLIERLLKRLPSRFPPALWCGILVADSAWRTGDRSVLNPFYEESHHVRPNRPEAGGIRARRSESASTGSAHLRAGGHIPATPCAGPELM